MRNKLFRWVADFLVFWKQDYWYPIKYKFTSLDFKVIGLGLWNLPWLTYREFWPYILAPDNGWSDAPYFQTVLCRLAAHPRGIVFFTHGMATEPDNHCKVCGDDLG